MPDQPDFVELGSSGLRRSGGTITEEFLTNLQGVRGSKVFREMADNDPVIGAMLFAFDKIIGRLDWHIEPEDNTPLARQNAEFVQSCLDDMSDSWDATLASILSMLPYGWSYHEIVYKLRAGDNADPSRRSRYSDYRIGWRKFAVRAQETLQDWIIDEHGGIQGMIQSDPSGGGTHVIPIDKALLFRTTTNRNNPEGRSILRNAYRPWYYKKRIEEIEAVGIERDLAGLPIAYVPPEFLSSQATPAQAAVLQTVKEIVQNIKRNEQEGIVFPAAYDDAGNRVFDIQLLSASGSRQFDTGAVIQRYDTRIAMSLLSDFILLGSDRVGSFALGSSKIDLWTMAVDAVAKSIAEVINAHAIPRLMRYNHMDASKMPSLTYGEVSHVDLNEVADFVQKLSTAGVIMPDADLELHMRQIGGLPAPTPDDTMPEA